MTTLTKAMVGEAAAAWRVREAMAVRVKTIIIPSVNWWEGELGLPRTQVPDWSSFAAPSFQINASPLIGSMTPETMARLDYFSWQAFNNLERVGTMVTYEPRLPFGPWRKEEFDNSPVPSIFDLQDHGRTELLAFQAAVGPKKGQLIGRPGQGTHSYTSWPNNWQSDHAVDISLPRRTPIVAIADGVICRNCGFGPQGGGPRFAGNRLTMNYGLNLGRNAYYAHLDEIVVRPGERVRAGQIIGYSGEANGSPHLHFATDHYDPVRIATTNRVKPWR